MTLTRSGGGWILEESDEAHSVAEWRSSVCELRMRQIPNVRGQQQLRSRRLRVQEVNKDCTLGELFSVDPLIATSASVTAGSAGYGIAWVSSSGPRFRLFGPSFCD